MSSKMPRRRGYPLLVVVGVVCAMMALQALGYTP